jgi:hypothetical protein
LKLFTFFISIKLVVTEDAIGAFFYNSNPIPLSGFMD